MWWPGLVSDIHRSDIPGPETRAGATCEPPSSHKDPGIPGDIHAVYPSMVQDLIWAHAWQGRPVTEDGPAGCQCGTTGAEFSGSAAAIGSLAISVRPGGCMFSSRVCAWLLMCGSTTGGTSPGGVHSSGGTCL